MERKSQIEDISSLASRVWPIARIGALYCFCDALRTITEAGSRNALAFQRSIQLPWLDTPKLQGTANRSESKRFCSADLAPYFAPASVPNTCDSA